MEKRYEIPRVSCRLALMENEKSYCPETFDGPDAAIAIMKSVMGAMDTECFVVVNLDPGLRPINWQLVSMGGSSCTMVPFPDIFKSTILSNSSKIMVFHNHPSGSDEPSEEDKRITKKIMRAGKTLDIQLIDHIIIGASSEEYYSFHQHGELK